MRPASPTPDFTPVRESIHKRMLSKSIPGVAVAVARDGLILWEEGFGWADREKQLPVTPHTLFSLASISKPITATAIMLLQQRKKLNLDGPANDYLGAAKIQGRAGSAAGATVRRLANHTSGLPTHFQFFYADEPHRPPSMDETIRRYANLTARPGERYRYSNLGYGILDYLVARLSHKSFADFVREEIFLPLGMTHSSLNIAPGLEPFAATRYGPDGVAYPHYVTDHPGASEFYCSAHDLLNFGLFHLKARMPGQKAILTDAAIDQMQAARLPAKLGMQYGVGWAVWKQHGFSLVGHGGGMGGVNTSLVLVPSERIAVVVLTNLSGADSNGLAQEILSALLPRFSQRRAAAQQKEEEKKRKAPKKARTPKLSRSLRGTWQGKLHTYNGEIAFKLQVQPSGDIHARLGTQLKALVNDPKFSHGCLTGRFIGDVGTEDANRRKYHLHLDLKRRGNRLLNGAVLAVIAAEGGDGGAPGRRVGNCLNHWTELRRQR